MKYIIIFLFSCAAFCEQVSAQQKVTIGGPGSGGGGADGGVIVMKAVGTTPNANSATIIDDTLQLQIASASFPGVVKAGTNLDITGDGTLSSLMKTRINTGGTTYSTSRINFIAALNCLVAFLVQVIFLLGITTSLTFLLLPRGYKLLLALLRPLRHLFLCCIEIC